jgi:Type IV leader peptidase family.
MDLILSILMDAFFVALLVWCACADLKTRTVPNLPVVLLLGLGLAHTALMLMNSLIWWTYPAGLLLSIPFIIAWLKNSMGAGDVKLIMGIGLYLGLLNTLVSFALMIPLLVILTVHSWRKNKTVKSAIPFAPVLAFGAGGAVILGYLYALM